MYCVLFFGNDQYSCQVETDLYEKEDLARMVSGLKVMASEDPRLRVLIIQKSSTEISSDIMSILKEAGKNIRAAFGEKDCLLILFDESEEQYFLTESRSESRTGYRTITSGMLGYCHKYWQIKKQILKELFGLDWKSPAERNPWNNYD